jgi:ADP-heptose:LPS heptosyltransferase
MDAFNLSMPTEPWLKVGDPIVIEGKPIVVNRTERYQDWTWPWTALIEKFHDQMVFVGTEKEHELFCGLAPHCRVEYRPTKDALELARVIAGAKLFIGNQSLALAIAHGLGKQVRVEEWRANPNTRIIRQGAAYGPPEELLK